MTFSLQVAGGDLVQQGSRLNIVSGVDKLKQDLTLWMTERYGIDRFHPGMGSNFQNYIGGIINYRTQQTVQQEATRVLDNYQKVQWRGLREAPNIYSLSELLYTINAVNVTLSFDAVMVNISVSNAVRQTTAVQVMQGT